MRIAVLSRNFSSIGGGAERYSVALVAQLAQLRQPDGQQPLHEIHVFAQHVDAHPQARIAGVSYHLIPMPLRRPRWLNQSWFAFATWKLTRHGFDIVHSHENSWHGNVQTVHVLPIRHTLFVGRSGLALALRWLKVCTSPRLLTYLWLERARYANQPGRRVVPTSHALQETLAHSYAQTRGAMEVIAPGIDHAPGRCSAEEQRAARAELGLPLQGPGILFVGNDFRKKGLPALLQALARSGAADASPWLAVVGQGEQDAAMRNLAQRLGVAARVYFVGALQQMAQAYRAADCLVHPTWEDTYAMVVLEALAHGLPVAVSQARYCGITGELTAGVHALVLNDPRDAAEIATAIDTLLTNHDLAQRMAVAAQQFAVGKTWAGVAAQYQRLYTALAPPRRQRWLVLAHAFNMDGRAASQTITDKLPHLERAGIEVVVLSGVSGTKDTHYEHHQLWPAGPAGLRFELRHVLRRHLHNRLAYRAVMFPVSLALLPFLLIEKWFRPVESSWSWWISAYFKGLGLMRKRPFDLIYSTGGAFAAHIAGAALKRATGIRWLAEVHDPMVVPGTVPSTPQQKMQARVETTICRHADVVIWFTDQALASAKQRNPELGARGHMMLPGVDAPPYALQPYVRGEKMVIGHFGSLSPTRNLAAVMAALDMLLDQQLDMLGKIELHITGGPLDPVSAQALAHMRHPTAVRHFGRIETDPVTGKSGREQILQRMRSADVLLLMHGIEPICAEYIPSKMYEYLWMQRPILALVHCNAQMADILRGMGHTVVETDRYEATASLHLEEPLEAALSQLLTNWQQSNLKDQSTVSTYTTLAAVTQLTSLVLN